MGTSFRNMQVYNPGHNNHYDVDEAFCVEHLAPDWDTILDDDFSDEFEEIRDAAVSLSEDIEQPVISISYFDDMLFALEVLEKGDSVAYHFVGDEQMDTRNVPGLMKALHLDPSLEIPFRNVLKKVSFAPDSVRLIEALARVPIGAYYVVEGAEDYYKFRDLNETLSEISEL